MKIPRPQFQVTKKRLIIGVAIVAVLTGLLLVKGALDRRHRQAQLTEYDQALKLGGDPAGKEASLKQTATEQYNTLTKSIAKKNAYTKQDLPALVNAAQSASVLKKKADAQKYAREALELIEKQPDVAKQYPQLVAMLKKLAGQD